MHFLSKLALAATIGVLVRPAPADLRPVPDSTLLQSKSPSGDSPASSDSDDGSPSAKPAPPANGSAAQIGTLQPQSRLEIIRFVDGEFAKAVQPLPRGKDGFKFSVGKPIDSNALQASVRTQGIAANKGDTVQITSVEFHDKQIVVLINGGAKKKFHLREHLQVGVGSDPSTVGPTYSHAGEGLGSVLILDYGRSLPSMGPDDLKRDLSLLLDFSSQPSATTNWVDTLKPEFKQAIEDHEALVGMNDEMVIASMGRPERKVREKDAQGNDTEDWIYGNPPAKTTFVTFADGKVIRVKEFD